MPPTSAPGSWAISWRRRRGGEALAGHRIRYTPVVRRSLVLATLLLSYAPGVLAATWTVDDDGGADFLEVAAALDAAQDGDTVAVNSGTYGPFTITRPVSIIGVDGADTTFVMGDGFGAVEIVADATLSGFTFESPGATALRIENCAVAIEGIVVRGSGDVTLPGGGVHVSNADVAMANSVFSENVASVGGAFAADSLSNITLTGCSFDGNGASTDGGAVHLNGNVTATFSHTTFDANTASTGGGGAVYVGAQSHLTEDNGTYSDNTAYGYGGSVYGYDGALIDESLSTFADGTALYGYGGNVFQYYRGYFRATETTFSGGLSYYDGGNIYLSYLDQQSTFDRVTIRDGIAQYSNGGGMEVYYYSDVRISDSEVLDNQAYSSGGGLYLTYATRATVERTTVSGNRATLYNGGGLAFDALLAASADLSVSASSFGRNVCGAQGGGIYANVPVALSITDTDVSNNLAGATSFGGGVHIRQPGSVLFTNNRVTTNTGGYGGGVYAESFPGRDIDDLWANNLIASNQARIGGGACFVYDTQTTFINNTVVENAASEAAGGICASEDALDLRNNILGYTRSGAALTVYDAESAAGMVNAYNDWYANADGDVDGETPAVGGSNLFVDPMFLRYSANGIEDDSFLLRADSPMIDAGDPAVDDLDGSRSDIGATGGNKRSVADKDLDGIASDADCDDADASVYPGADDAWYDGVDSNCDGADDDDQDGDGVRLADDCDDADASVGAHCEEELASGHADKGTAPRSCGCQTGRGAPGTAALVVAFLVGRRRRYATSPSARATPGR